MIHSTESITFQFCFFFPRWSQGSHGLMVEAYKYLTELVFQDRVVQLCWRQGLQVALVWSPCAAWGTEPSLPQKPLNYAGCTNSMWTLCLLYGHPCTLSQQQATPPATQATQTAHISLGPLPTTWRRGSGGTTTRSHGSHVKCSRAPKTATWTSLF